MKVLKFGGSSVGTPDSIRQVIDIISSKKAKGETVAVVVSAFQGITDELQKAVKKASDGDNSYEKILRKIEHRHQSVIKDLVSIKNQSGVLAHFKMMLNELDDVLHGVLLVRELTGRTKDFVLSFGERFSAYILSECLSDRDIEASYLDARKIILTDAQHGNARVQTEATYQKIASYFAEHKQLQVVTGFIASTTQGETTTLGRGGSDFTASLLGAALSAEMVEIWTDIEGVMTADPRKVNRYFPIPHLSYEEAMELSHFGARVIFPPTMQPVMKAEIPILIKNTFKPGQKGTRISGEYFEDQTTVKGISSIDDVSLITVRGSGMIGVSGVASRIFKALAEHQINIILITQASSEHTVCLAVMPQHADQAKAAIEDEFKYEIRDQLINEVMVEKELSIIAVVGDHMRNTPGISARVFYALGRNGINIVAIAQGSSERNISVVVNKKNESKALNALHDTFFLSGVKTVNLFVVGMGLIGGTMLDILKDQAQVMYDEYLIDMHLIGLANTNSMLINEEGIPLKSWKKAIEEDGEKCDMDQFVSRMKELNLPNSVFVDCTASAELPEYYRKVLQSNISIATPNKKANSGSQSFYENLKQDSIRNNIAFRYETNVGAGLPVVATIHEQVSTGDKVHKIEGVLSGTLSYIFNTYDGKKPFSQLVREAREKGYTEPDPREDLNGHDVARKLLILIREAGYKMEFEDVEIQNLVPEDARDAADVEAFFEQLSEHDDDFKALYDSAADEDKKLCYIARYQDGKATVRLEKIGVDHPFINLSGSDNIIAINSLHYKDSPMVIKGPGAGANVTASGVIADILRIVNTAAFSNTV